MTKYQSPRNTRRSFTNHVGKLRGGKLVPVKAEPARPSEGGMLSQKIRMMLDPIPGQLITDMTAEVYMVYVPVQAIDAIKDPGAAYAGLTDVIREKFLSGTPLFDVENEGEISKRCGIVPRSVGGAKKVSEMVRLAHNAAVNHLRLKKYVKAALLLHSNTAVTPAILGQTVLDRLNSVLDPEDRVNGSVSLDVPGQQALVKGLFLDNASNTSNKQRIQPADVGGALATAASETTRNLTAKYAANAVESIYADVKAAGAADVSLTDFYNAEKMDNLVREMRLMIDNNPEYGEEMVINWAHGLSVDAGSVPWVIAERKMSFFKAVKQANDTTGIEDDVMRTDGVVEVDIAAIIPNTELGGIIITFAVLKPDENLASQPHPILSDVWTADNFVADELKIDPVPITYRDVYSEVATGDEALISSYGGYNHLKLNYVNYGFNRQVDPATVENKAAVWQLNIPMSVSPEGILYPSYLDHGVFAFGGTEGAPTEVCTYNIQSTLTFQSPMIIGPTPVEELAMIETADLFQDA